MEYAKETNNSGEVTLKELIQTTERYIRHLWAKKIWIILIALLGGAYGFYKAYKTPVTYTAELTFMVNEDDGSSIGGLGSILGQFGLGGQSSSEYNLDKIIYLGLSKKIINAALLDSVYVANKNDLLANHIIKYYDLQATLWKKDSSLSNFSFQSDDLANFNAKALKAIRDLYIKTTGVPSDRSNALIQLGFHDQTGILKIEAFTPLEELSIAMTDVVYKNLSSFYISKSTEKQRATFENIQTKVDSIRTALNKAEYAVARFDDSKLGLVKRTDGLNRAYYQRDITVLQIMYGEALKNLEASSFMLKNATPFFQLIDKPAYPLKKNSASTVRNVILYAILAGLMLSIIFLLIYSYKQIMQ